MSLNIVVVFVVTFYAFPTCRGISVNFVASRNVTTKETAVYSCSLILNATDDVTAAWVVNEISSTTPSWQSYITSVGIQVKVTDIHSSMLIIPGDPMLNRTTVVHRAIGVVNGKTFIDITEATLFIQGKPAGVDLNCAFSLYTIKCHWSIPYTISGVDITGYYIKVNVNDTSNNVITTTVNETEYAYNVSEPGVYNVSVAAMIGELEGEYNSSMISVQPPQLKVASFIEDNSVTTSIQSSSSVTSTTTDSSETPTSTVTIINPSSDPETNTDMLFTQPLIVIVVVGAVFSSALILVITTVIFLIAHKYSKKIKSAKNMNVSKC